SVPYNLYRHYGTSYLNCSRPRLRSTVQAHRQHFRGRMWHVLQDPASNQFYQLNDPAYRFVALLDGRRTVAEAWRICNEQLGDEAPTQGEVIQLLGQLYVANLLLAELPPDVEGMFKRYRKRRGREVRGYLSNFLFIHIPLIDPERFLQRWVGVVGKAFTKTGFVLWLALMAIGLYHVAGNTGELFGRAGGILDVANLPLLYAALVLVKVTHEFSHSFACKHFGRESGTGGEVHVMGVMFLVFTPLPYMDASSAWAFRDKWHRVVVGSAGMLAELAVAAIAAIVWARTGDGALNALCYNMMFIASVSSLLFNGNPLLRYDAYYILSDLVEIPNLSQRSKEYIYYLVKRYVWRVRSAHNPAHTRGERGWFVFYGVASTLYRVFILSAILIFIAGQFLMVGAVLAVAAFVLWVCVPLGKFVHYLATSNELLRVRGWATGSTVGFVAAVVAALGLIPMPDHVRVEGIVEPVDMAVVYARADGWVTDYLPTDTAAEPDGQPLVVCENPLLEARLKDLEAERTRLEVRRRLARGQEGPAAEQIVAEQLSAVVEQITRIREQLDAMSIRAPRAGTWVAPDIDRAMNSYLRRGDRVGLVAKLDELIIRAPAGQDTAALLISEADAENVEIRPTGRPDLQLTGRITRFEPAGRKRLPSPALGYAFGGPVETAADDPEGVRTKQRMFELRISPDSDYQGALRPGRRVVTRFALPPKPLLAQARRALLQLAQKRFGI
ncbi:MAG: PqqD family peptide modification chaperone, partial [Planctomycetota bacterium]